MTTTLDKVQTAQAAKGDQTVFGLVQSMRDQFAAALPRQVDPDRFVRTALTVLRTTPKLQECTSASLLGALMTCAQLGLDPSGPLGHAYLVPYGRECTLIVGYRGEIELAYRSGAVETVVARTVHANDHFEWAYGIDEQIVHKPVLGDRGELIAVYAVAKMQTGGHVSVVLSVDDVNKFRDRSKASKSGPWVTDYDAMAMKTAVRRLSTWLPMSLETAAAHQVDGRPIREMAASLDDLGTVIDVDGDEVAE